MNRNSFFFIYKMISIPLFLFLIYIIVFIARFTLSEGYNIYAPYADTKMSEEYSPDKFDLIIPGMKMTEVYKIIGKPLTEDLDPYSLKIRHSFTSDGNLLHKSNSFWIPGDLAWYGSSVEYNNDSIVVKVYSGWHYD